MDPKKVYPTVEELSKVNTAVACPEKDCSSVFKSESNLNLHLAKTHKKVEYMKKDSSPREYYCPKQTCEYNKSRCFKTLKLLKQHYLKVHCEKTYSCDTCDMKFSTLTFKNSHMNYCGVNFTCCNCKASYPTYESLLTHGRRRNHQILEKNAYKLESLHISASALNLASTKDSSLYVVRGSTSLHCINNIAPRNTIMIERSSQTDLLPKTRKGKLRQVNQQETQTHRYQKMQLTAETQTIGDYFDREDKLGMINSKLSLNLEDCSDSLRKDIKTQTQPIDSTTKSCNTSFNLDDLSLFYERNSSSTQTTAIMDNDNELLSLLHSEPFNQIGEFIHTGSQTSFHEDMETFDSSNFYNTETQTEFMSMSEPDYTSICTQTGEVVFPLFDEMEFNSSHTQTMFEDVLRSVESQTMMSTHSKPLLSCRDMAHMETQTDEFKQMLEEINA